MACKFDMPLIKDNHASHAKAIPDPAPTNKNVLQVRISAVLQHSLTCSVVVLMRQGTQLREGICGFLPLTWL